MEASVLSSKVLRQNVMDELECEPTIDAAHIGVAVEAGVVTLTGQVGNYSEKLRVEQAVRRVKGVKGIAEQIEVQYPGKKLSDGELTKLALDLLDWDVDVPGEGIAVRVEKGWITLIGTVKWHFERQAAESAVRKLPGIRGVNNQISLEPTEQLTNIKKLIGDALSRRAEIVASQVSVSVEGDKVKLEGRVKSWHERQLAEQAAWAAPGVRYVENLLWVG